MTGISNTNGGSASALTIQSNDFRGITHSVAGSASHTYISNSVVTLSQTISSNTFTNLNVNTSGSVTFLSNAITLTSTGSMTLNSNSIVTAFNKGSAGGTVTVFSSNASSAAGSTVSLTNNNFSNITVTGATSFVGINNTDGGAPTKTITGNTFNSISGGSSAINPMTVNFFGGSSSVSTNTITNITWGAAITALTIGGSSSATTLNVNSNVINSIFSTGGAVTGITSASPSTTTNLSFNLINTLSSNTGAIIGQAVTGGTTSNLFKNKIYDLSGSNTASTVTGILVSGGATNNVYNNIVGDLRTPAANITIPLVGINASGGTTDNIYFNTVLLNATSSGSPFGSIAMWASSTPTVNLRNNIFVNTSTAAGTGITAAYRRTTATLTTYASTSNNNLFYAGTPSSNNLIFYDGTNSDQTLTAFKSRVSTRDAASISENPPFLSTTGSSATFLHINTATPTFIESGGAPIAGITDDYDGDTRNVTTPDIGADEGTFTAPVVNDLSATSFVDPTSGATKTTAGFTPQASFSNNGTATQTSVTVRYRILDNTLAEVYNQTTTIASIATGVTSTSSFPATGALAAGAYTIKAKAELVGDTVSANDEITGTLNVRAPLAGIYTVGSGGNYATITAALADLNVVGVSAATTLSLTSATYPSETFPINIPPIAGASATNTITIKPNTGVSPTITGSGAATCVVNLNGADYVTIDGSNTVNGTSRDLSIVGVNTSASTAVVCVTSLGAGAGATFDTIKNTNISGATNTVLNYGISVGSTPGLSGADNDNLTIQNNAITIANTSVWALGTASVSSGGLDALNITGNTVTSNSALQNYGIEVGNALNSTINGNTVSVTSSGTVQPVGISLEAGFVSSTVNANKITNVLATSSGGYGGRGITIGTGTATSALTISNNVIYGVNGSNWSSFGSSSSMGIAIGTIGGSGTLTTTTGGVNLYFNSVNMTGSMGSGSTTALTTALYVGSAATALDIRNNIFANTQVGTSTTQKNYAIYSAAANTAFSTINYNDYYVTNTFNAASAIPGFIGSDRTNLAGIVTGFGGNANSKAVDPQFTSTTNLQPQLGSPVLAAGTPVSVTTDITGAARSVTAPSIGAYEAGADLTGPVITYTALGNTLLTTDQTLSVTATDVSGVPTSGTGLPVLYFRKGASGAFSSNQCSFVSGSNYSCSTNYAAFGGVVAGNTVQYYVAAQDSLGNVSTNPSTGATGFTANPPAASTPPTTPNSYLISAAISGTLTANSGGTYTSLTNAGGIFDYINNNVVTGNITVNITSDLTAETGAVALNQFASPYTLTIQPSGAARTVSGTSTGTLIRLNGADGVTFDGSVGGGGTDKSLTVTNTTTTTGGVFGVLSLGTGAGSVSDTIKNCVISTGSIGTTANFTYGIFVGDTSGAAAGAGNDNLTIQNNTIRKARSGIQMVGVATTGIDQNTVITGNLIGDNTIANSIGRQGLLLSIANNATVTGNTIKNIALSSDTSSSIGMSLSTLTSSTVSQNTITGITTSGTSVNAGAISMSGSTGTSVSQNTISSISSSAATSSVPFGISIGSSSAMTLSQNSISSVTATTSGAVPIGISLATFTGSTVSRNSIDTISNSSSGDPSGISVGTGVTTTTFDRNTVSNVTYTGTGGYGGRGLDINTGNAASSLTFSNNMIWNIKGDGWSDFTVDSIAGVRILGTTGGLNFYDNSINLGSGSFTGNTSGTLSAAFYVGSTVTALDLRNNIFTTNLVNSNAAAAKSYAIYSAAANTSFTTTDYNDYFVSGTQGVLGFLTSDRTNLLGIQTSYGGNTNSKIVDPLFTSATNLHLTTASTLINAGTTIGPAIDIDGDARPQGAAYDIGADEILAYTIGGSVSGLNTSGLVLQNNLGDNLSIASGASGFVFATSIPNGGIYSVTVQTQPTGQTCVVTNPSGTVAAVHVTSVAVTCTTNTFTITASSGGNGSVTPTGGTTVNYGGSQAYTITPDAGYIIANVLVDAVSQGAIANYTFSNVTASHTISATFAANTFTVTFDPNGGGTPSPTSKSVTYAGTYGTLATVSRTGYTFNGWFTAASGGTLVTAATTVAITAAQTLYAQWTDVPPTLTAVNIVSNNANPVWAKTGDTVSVTFTASEPLLTPTVTIGGAAALVAGGTTTWTASRAMVSGDTEGAVAFNIAYSDLNSNAGTAVTAVTDASSVTFDKTAPAVTVTVFPTVNNANTAAVTISGACENGFAISLAVTDAGSAHTVNASPTCSSAAWTAIVDLTTLNDGTVTATATQTDTAGNIGSGNKTATKNTVTYTLNVATVGSGSVTKNPDQANYNDGTSVALTAVPDTGWMFNGWSGDTEDAANLDRVPLVIITGESNSGGYAVNEDATAAELSARPGVQILNNNTLLFEDLDIGTNNLIGHAGLPDNATHGFELGLANSVVANDWPNAPVYLVKTGQGGSTISQWAVGSSYWTTFNQRVSAAVNLLTANGKTPMVYILYSHGINDAIAGTPVATWKNDTIAHLAKVRRAVGPSSILMTRLMSPTYDTYNTAIDEIDAADALTSAITVSGATLRDTNHWDYAGMKLISSRMVTVMRASGGGSVTTNPLSVTMNRNRSLTANFIPIQYTLTYTAGSNGSITGTSPQTVNYGTNGTAVTAVPATGYHFVNWSDASVANPRTDATVTANVSVMANFAANNYTITFNSNGGSAVTAITQAYGTTVTAPPAPTRAGYTFSGWYTDNGTFANPYTFSTMGLDITLYAKWTATNFTITSSAGTGGSISPLGAQTVTPGTNQSFTITPTTGYAIATVLVDGANNPGAVSTGSYTFTNVQAGHTIAATFKPTIAGTVTYDLGTVHPAIPGVTISTDETVPVTATTDAAGAYVLTNFSQSIGVKSKPTLFRQNCIAPNGITANDASAVSKHVIGLATLTGNNLLAADVSGQGDPSSYDAALIARYVVGADCTTPVITTNAGNWVFTPAERLYSNVTTPQLNQNFTGFVIGDTDGLGWTAAGGNRPAMAETPGPNAVAASVPAMAAVQGALVNIPFRIDNLQSRSLSAYQFDVEYDPAVITPAVAAANIAGTRSEGLAVVSNSPQPGLLKVAVYGAIPVGGDGVYVNLRFTVTGGTGTETPLAIRGFLFDDGSQEVTATDGRLTVVSSAGNADIRGRVLSATGQPIAKARVTVTDSTGASRTIITSPFGYYEFGGLVTGETYTVTAAAKQHSFQPRTVSVATSVVDLDMIADQ